jgi:hypothetical protein
MSYNPFSTRLFSEIERPSKPTLIIREIRFFVQIDTPTGVQLKKYTETNTRQAFFNTMSFLNARDLLKNIFDMHHIESVLINKIKNDSGVLLLPSQIQFKQILNASNNDTLTTLNDTDKLLSEDNKFIGILEVILPDYKNKYSSTKSTESAESLINAAKTLSLQVNKILHQLNNQHE